MKILVSACLLGVNCKYNGESNENEDVLNLIDNGIDLIPICPEQLGGITTPRNPVEIVEYIQNGELKYKVVDSNGNDFTKQFVFGANESLKIAKIFNCKKAILKSKSPSCGNYEIYDGSFSKQIKKGVGITTSLFRQNQIDVISEIDLKKWGIEKWI